MDRSTKEGESGKESVRAPLGEEGSYEDAIELPEEVQEVKPLKSPQMPTQEEVAQHRVTHLPYRCWCPECVEAFAREWAHKKKSVARTIPLVSCDYLYLTKNGVFGRDELDEA